MKRFVFFLSTFCALYSHAQQYKLNVSNEFELGEGQICKIGNFFYRRHIEVSETRFMLVSKLSNVTHSVTLYKYDANMNEIKKVELENGNKVFGPFFSQLINFDGTLILCYYKYLDKQTIKFYVSKIDPETLSFVDTKEVFSFDQKNFVTRSGGSYLPNDNSLFTQLSPDKRTLLLIHSNTNQINSCIIDKNLSLTKNTSSQSPSVKDFETQFIFLDDSGNKYLSYKYIENKEYRRGVMIQNSSGKESFQYFNTGNQDFQANDINFKNSRDNSRIYAYANFYGNYLNEGVVIATLDANNLKINQPKLIPYTDEIKQRMYKLDFGQRSKSKYSVTQISYYFNELEDGTINLTGGPEVKNTDPKIRLLGWAGPIVSIFINSNKNIFSIIPRRQVLSKGSACVIVPYKNSVVCIYCDGEKNLQEELSDKVRMEDKPDDMVLASALIRNDGSITNRKVIGDNAVGKKYYFVSEAIESTKNNFVIPMGHTKHKAFQDVTEYLQWANLTMD